MDGTGAQPAWLSYLPLAILALVMVWRMRRLNRARRLRPAMLLVLPLLYLGLVGVMLWALPPSVAGWLWLAGGIVVGGLVGWQRARLMRLHIDPDHKGVMVRQSPAALILLVGIVALRRILFPTAGMSGADVIKPEALIVTDALIGFALGMIVAQRAELWRRARALMATPTMTRDFDMDEAPGR